MLSLRFSHCRSPALLPARSALSSCFRRGYRLTCAAQKPDGTEEATPSLPPGRDQPALRKMPYGALCALSSLGLLETAYLTVVKLTHAPVACPLSGGCANVLTSDYANFLGLVPLTVLGMLAYGSMAALSAYGVWLARSQASHHDAQDHRLRLAAVTLGTVMASCSGYLMYILATKFPGETCPWCIVSALLSFSIAGLSASGMGKRELQDAAGPELGLAATTLLLLSVGLGSPSSVEAGDMVLSFKEPAITSESSPQAVQLAKKLAAAGAKMYGAFWCSHCYDQKDDFGAQAMADFPYVECFPEGWQKGVQMAPACQAAGLEGFPTWVIGNQRLMGEQTFEQLEEALGKAVSDVAAVGAP